ncbi:venom peptide isomerase heavy chain-like [Oppia nitens]|uniref:venom peptide isomerase heavy chain-like n=1 Tax=Oppia nitens TaxID=1686743 RepID=UPI0023DBD102|nr:venom peptide isomerase heavy chain-like [Oppia nitens]
MSVSSVVHSVIKHYPNVTLIDCGVGRESLLMTGQCLHSYDWTKHIENGRQLETAEMPWIVFIIVKQNGGHCRLPFKSSDHRIYTGIQDKSHLTDYYTSDDYFIPNQFRKAKQRAYDLALIRLSKPLNLMSNTRYKTINGICLPKEDIINTNDELALIAGYGAINDTTDLNGRPHMGWLKIMKPEFDSNDSNGTLILAERAPGGSLSCKGDSGGPLLQYINGRAVLIGVIQGGVSSNYCPEINFPAYYVRLSKHIEWIKQIVGQ